MTQEIRVGHFAVFRDGWDEFPRYVAQRVVRVTAQKLMTREGAYRERHHAKESVLFVGAEERCLRLCDRLQGSVGLMSDEVRRSRQRHHERAAKIIEEMST